VSSAERHAADADARLVAQREFERPVVLEAGAGTGKTTVLVARIVVWCVGEGWERNAARLEKSPGAPKDERRVADRIAADQIAAEVLRRVVAITFTEAAAAQMATCVGEALLALVSGRLPLGVAEDALPPDVEIRRERARSLLASLDQLAVRTIHAWCRRLLAAQPLEIGLHPRFEVDADGRRTAEVLREVLERQLATAYAGDAAADHLLLAGVEVGPPELEEAVTQLLEAGVPSSALAGSPFSSEALAALHAALVEALEAFAKADGGCLAGAGRARVAVATAEAGRRSRELCAAGVPDGIAALVEWSSALRALWQKSARERLAKWGREDFVAAERAALAGREPQLAASAAALAALLDHLLAIDPEALEAARRVLHPLLAELEEELRRRGVESFEALLQDTRRLLAEHPDAAARVRAGIDQLLVDEFQDTDRTQCAILAALALTPPIGENEGKAGLGLFLVGDPKQSIYGWRNADLAAYEDFVARLRERGGRFHRLSLNFRSVPAILSEVERAMAPVMRPVPRRQPCFEPLDASPARAEQPGFTAGGRAPVEHWVSWGWQDGAADTGLRSQDAAELEARAIAQEIAELHREHGVQWNDVAMLFRALGDVEIYLEALRDAGVPYVVERDRSYYERREVIEARSLVRCVLDPRDHVALLALLRSAWVGVPDAALLPLWQEQFPARVSALRGQDAAALEAARAAVRAAAAGVTDGAPGIARLGDWERSLLHAVECLDHLRGAQEKDPPDEFVEKLRALVAPEPSEAARYLGLFRLANLDRFFRDLVAALEQTGGDVGAVLAGLRTLSEAREAEEGRPRDAAQDAVHVLSIHKAKGLDFEQVYLVQLHRAGKPATPSARSAATDGGFEYQLFGRPTPGFHATARAAEQVEAAERVRTLYVAMTRPRQRLVLCGRPGRPAGTTRAADPERARSHVELLELRAPGVPDRAALMVRAAAAGGCHVDAAETRWVFPALREPDPAPAGAESEAQVATPGLRRSVEALTRARVAARQREARAFRGVASEEKPLFAVEAAVDALEGSEAAEELLPALASRELAQHVGTAVHAALEVLDLGETAEQQRRPSVERAKSPRVEVLLERFFAGDLHPRLRALAPHVIARELPVLLAAEDGEEGPVGFVAGAIDLLYRDPESAELVVADYKSDAVASVAEAGRKAADYRGQGECYVRAVQQALALDRPPRFELWFLAIGHVQASPSSTS
jgi:ATP-dependent helicase/nuclease subunit A